MSRWFYSHQMVFCCWYWFGFQKLLSAGMWDHEYGQVSKQVSEGNDEQGRDAAVRSSRAEESWAVGAGGNIGGADQRMVSIGWDVTVEEQSWWWEPRLGGFALVLPSECGLLNRNQIYQVLAELWKKNLFRIVPIGMCFLCRTGTSIWETVRGVCAALTFSRLLSRCMWSCWDSFIKLVMSLND